MISLQSFAVLVHETFCSASDECMYINMHTEETDNEYESFREIVQCLKLLYPYYESDQPGAQLRFAPTNYGIEFLSAHNIKLPKQIEENHE